VALCNDQEPATGDIDLLRAHYPDYSHMDTHEIACAVIEEQIQKKREARMNKVMTAGGGV